MRSDVFAPLAHPGEGSRCDRRELAESQWTLSPVDNVCPPLLAVVRLQWLQVVAGHTVVKGSQLHAGLDLLDLDHLDHRRRSGHH